MHEVELVNKVYTLARDSVLAPPRDRWNDSLVSEEWVEYVVRVTLEALGIKPLPDGQINIPTCPANYEQFRAWAETPAGKEWLGDRQLHLVAKTAPFPLADIPPVAPATGKKTRAKRRK